MQIYQLYQEDTHADYLNQSHIEYYAKLDDALAHLDKIVNSEGVELYEPLKEYIYGWFRKKVKTEGNYRDLIGVLTLEVQETYPAPGV